METVFSGRQNKNDEYTTLIKTKQQYVQGLNLGNMYVVV